MKRLIALLCVFTLLVSGMIACEQSPEAPSRKASGPSPETLDPEMYKIIHDLGSESEDVREAAFEALVNIGPEAIPALTQALREDEDEDVRWAVVTVLGEIEPEAVEAIPALIQALEKDKDEWVRMAAAEALGEMGPDAVLAIPALIQALGDESAQVRAYVALALGWIGPEARGPFLPSPRLWGMRMGKCADMPLWHWV